MSRILDINQPESRNWLKQWRAVFVTRQAILPTVSTEATQLHGDILHKAQVPACTTCSFRDVQNRRLRCHYHTVFRGELVNEHAYGLAKGIDALTLKNTKAENWIHSPWEIAKVFMPPAGYENKTTIEETDFNGIAGFIINCKRFQGKITGSICEKAREVVNHIRHMPDSCSSALTDQATTECIDKLLTLLNESALQTRSEVLQACRELDELKTADISKDVHACKYICQELHDEFQQRLAGIEMKLQTTVIDTESAKEYICTESKNLKEELAALEHFSDNAMHDLLGTKDNILLSFNEERRRIMDRITLLEQKAAENIEQSVTEGKRTLERHVKEERRQASDHIEQSVADGKRTLERHVKEERRQASEHIEQSVTDGKRTIEIYVREERRQAAEHIEQSVTDGKRTLETHVQEEAKQASDHIEQSATDGKRTIEIYVREERRQATEHIELAVTDGKRTLEDQTERLVKQLRKEEVEHLEEKKNDLKEKLINHYKTNSVRTNVRLDIDAAVEDIYETPKLILKNKKNKDGKFEDEDISEINKMFQIDNGKMAKKIFVEGGPGSGKSVLCIKIVNDWCKLKEDDTKETQKDNMLSQIEFLFYIRLREVENQCKVKEMILQCLIELIQSDENGSNELLTEILKSEHCLLLLDGLDEWTHRTECKLDERIPHVESSWLHCTTLITTRPYKLAELKVSNAKLGKHVQLQGVQSPEKLVRRILGELGRSHQVEGDTDTCVNDIELKGLWHFSDVPIMLVHIVWLWHRGKLKDKMTLYSVYRKIMKERWCEMCEKKHIQEKELPKDFLYGLGELAFQKLFSAREDESIVFKIKGSQLEKFGQYKQTSLESGIISCTNRAGERSASFQFLHKTIQEYLSAWYLANCGSDLSEMCKHIQTVYLHNRSESVTSLSEMFLFLCSVNKTAAEVFSKTLNELFTKHCERDGYSADTTCEFQNMILRGYDEAEKSGHSSTDLELCLQHIVFDDEFRDKVKKSKLCLDIRKSNLVSLHIDGILHSDLDLLDAEEPYDINQLNLCGLLECNIKFKDYQTASKLTSSFLSSDLKCLKSLTLGNFGWEYKAKEILSKLRNIEHLDLKWYKESTTNDSQLDIGHLHHLTNLSLSGMAFSDVVNLQMTNLKWLRVCFITKQRAPQLMTALSESLLNLSSDWSPFVLARVQLKNMLIPASLFRRLVKTVIQSGHEVNCTLEDCELEHEEDLTQLQAEMENQPAIQMVAPKPNSACFKKVFDLSISAMSERTFRCLVSMMIESRHSGRCNLRNCTITPKEDVRNVPEETENQATIQMVASQTASPDYLTFIYLNDVAMSERTFRCIVSMMVESRHSGKCTLRNCTLTPEEDVRNVLVETENQATIHMVASQTALPDYKTHFRLFNVAMSAGTFRCLVSMTLRPRHFVECKLFKCTIKAEEDVRPMQEEMENQHALQAVAPQKTEPCYETFIKSHCVTMPAKVVRNLVSMLIQSGHAGRHEIHYCKIEPEEDYDQLQTEMENRAAFWLTQQPVANDYATVIYLFDVKLSESMFRYIVNMVVWSGHNVDCAFAYCKIEPRDNQPVYQLVSTSTDYTTRITFRNMYIPECSFRHLVSMNIQSGHFLDCEFIECATFLVEEEKDVSQLMDEMENEPVLQVFDELPTAPDYVKCIKILFSTLSASVVNCLNNMVRTSKHHVDWKLLDCIIEPREDVRQLLMEMEDNSAIKVSSYIGENGKWNITLNENV
ncbi:uncharacterized protein LOC128229999 [Mya arenaria]|uniref:uncharacterized protein LOC128229999 n=1 Tax=Mya arenaria TaxID=6604 RepID=UPI0022E62B2D|nr:uncharacterized protein LOC128229999 [Mya arenaria]